MNSLRSTSAEPAHSPQVMGAAILALGLHMEEHPELAQPRSVAVVSDARSIRVSVAPRDAQGWLDTVHVDDVRTLNLEPQTHVLYDGRLPTTGVRVQLRVAHLLPASPTLTLVGAVL